MKHLLSYLSLGAILSVASCTKEKTVVIEPNGNTTTVTKVGLNDQTVDSAKIKVNNGLDKAGSDIKKGAKELKEDLKDATSDAAAALEKGAKKVKEDTKN